VVSPNYKFNLSLTDIDLIENALMSYLDTKIKQNDEQAVKEIRNLLGHIHQQKNWYRPTKKPYISG
jgi:hypothetical protein